MNRYIQASLEAIEQQNPKKLFIPLSDLMLRLDGCADDKERDRVIKDIEQLIRKVCGLNLTLEHTDLDTEIRFDRPLITLNFPYAYRAEKAVMKILAGQPIEMYNKKTLRGEVDLVNGRVMGDFANIPCRIFMPFRPATSGALYDHQERAAVVLHEIGHLVGLYECIGHETILALQQAAVVAAWLGKGKSTRTEVLANVSDALGMKFDDTTKLIEDDNVQRVCSVVAAMAVKAHRNELGLVHYDAVAFEQMSDAFAARHGAGRYLVTALDKAHRSFPAFFRKKGYRPTTLSALGAAGSFATLVGALVLAPIPAIGAVIGYTTMASYMAATSFTMGDYEEPAQRYASIRRELISSIKSDNHSPAYVKAVADDIALIDKIVDSLKADYSVSNFSNWLRSTVSGASKEISIRKQYEELANNSLFLKAQQLKSLV